MVKNPGKQIAGNPLSVVDIGWYSSIMFSQNKNPGFQLFYRPSGGHYSHPKKCQKVYTHFRSEKNTFLSYFLGADDYTPPIYTHDIFQYPTIFPLYPIDILKYSHDIFTIFPLSSNWIMIQHTWKIVTQVYSNMFPFGWWNPWSPWSTGRDPGTSWDHDPLRRQLWLGGRLQGRHRRLRNGPFSSMESSRMAGEASNMVWRFPKSWGYPYP
jgi:hypothetical protein